MPAKRGINCASSGLYGGPAICTSVVVDPSRPLRFARSGDVGSDRSPSSNAAVPRPRRSGAAVVRDNRVCTALPVPNDRADSLPGIVGVTTAGIRRLRALAAALALATLAAG